MALARLQMTQCWIEPLAAYACSNGVFPVFLIRIKIICAVLVNKRDRHLSCGTLGDAFRTDMGNFFIFIVFSHPKCAAEYVSFWRNSIYFNVLDA